MKQEINQETVDILVDAFIENKWRHTFSYSRLCKTYDATFEEVLAAKMKYKEIKTKGTNLNSEADIAKSIEEAIQQKTEEKEKEIQERDFLEDLKDMQVDRVWLRADGKRSLQLSKPKNQLSQLEAIEAFKESLKDYNFANLYTAKKNQYPSVEEDEEKTAVVCLFDIHLGKLSLYYYTNDFDITASEVKYEFDRLFENLKKQEGITKIVFPIGNDLFNVDGTMLTTSNGTPQDNDPDLYKAFKMGLNLSRYMIDSLKTIAPVEVPMVLGNHARYTEMLLGAALDSIYKNDANVTIDDSPLLRKYIKCGNTLLGLSHGEKKHDFYSRLLPFEAKEYFSSCKHFYILLGDKHHDNYSKKTYKANSMGGGGEVTSLQEIDGVTVIQLGALSRLDRWHYKEGYTFSRRQSYFLLFNNNRGLETQFFNLAGDME
jgi:hypothetical protein